MADTPTTPAPPATATAPAPAPQPTAHPRVMADMIKLGPDLLQSEIAAVEKAGGDASAHRAALASMGVSQQAMTAAAERAADFRNHGVADAKASDYVQVNWSSLPSAAALRQNDTPAARAALEKTSGEIRDFTARLNFHADSGKSFIDTLLSVSAAVRGMSDEQRAGWIRQQESVSLRMTGTPPDVLDLALKSVDELKSDIADYQKENRDTTKLKAALKGRETYEKFRADAAKVVARGAGDAGKISELLPKSPHWSSALLLRQLYNHGLALEALAAKYKK